MLGGLVTSSERTPQVDGDRDCASPRSTINIDDDSCSPSVATTSVRKKIKWAPLEELNTEKAKKTVSFADSCLVYRTFARNEYDRSPCGFSPEVLIALLKLKEKKEKRKREATKERESNSIQSLCALPHENAKRMRIDCN
jgi:hypothetical protein